MKSRRPSWRSEIFFWGLNSIFMQILPFVSLCKYGSWSHERTHSIVWDIKVNGLGMTQSMASNRNKSRSRANCAKKSPSNYANVCWYLTGRNKPILFFLEPFFPHRGRGATSPEQERVVGYIRDLFCSDCTKRLSTHLFFVAFIAKTKVPQFSVFT